MDEDWSIVKNDCLLFAGDLVDDSILVQSLSDSRTKVASSHSIKMEPEDTSDYHSSQSDSPESFVGGGYSPLSLHTAHSYHVPSLTLQSPSSTSVFGMSLCGLPMPLQSPLSPPLPPVSHFSTHFATSNTDLESFYNEYSPEMDGAVEEMAEESRQTPSPVSSGGLFHHRMQVRTRSKMHEMAVQHRLITEQDPRGSGMVQLSVEERRTLIQEGYSLPCKLPLSKAEEEALRVVRRKIKNKLSAQESRRKRKEYMDHLEQRLQSYATENSHLRTRLKQYENVLKKHNIRLGH